MTLSCASSKWNEHRVEARQSEPVLCQPHAVLPRVDEADVLVEPGAHLLVYLRRGHVRVVEDVREAAKVSFQLLDQLGAAMELRAWAER